MRQRSRRSLRASIWEWETRNCLLLYPRGFAQIGDCFANALLYVAWKGFDFPPCLWVDIEVVGLHSNFSTTSFHLSQPAFSGLPPAACKSSTASSAIRSSSMSSSS